MKNINWKLPVVILFVIISGGCYSLGTTKESVLLETVPAVMETIAEETRESAALAEEMAAEQPLYYVHICGEVRQAGVYQVPAGERIFRVVELAGGYTDEAATEYLNLAAEVADGMKLVVPAREEYDRIGAMALGASAGGGAKEADLRVNLNTATKEQLMNLPGIGESKAEAILKYRDEKGMFSNSEELMNISGIKQAAFDKIKDRIVVLK